VPATKQPPNLSSAFPEYTTRASRGNVTFCPLSPRQLNPCVTLCSHPSVARMHPGCACTCSVCMRAREKSIPLCSSSMLYLWNPE
jgi:hypothetical protein